MSTEIDLKLKRICRIKLGTEANIAVVVIPGSQQEPRLCGSSYHWTTRTGKPVYYPSAYSRVGWSSLCYHRSTRRIEVGEEWVKQIQEKTLVYPTFNGSIKWQYLSDSNTVTTFQR